MPLSAELYEHSVPNAQIARWERNKRLSVVRERIRQINEEMFELSCQLQRHFDPKDVRNALVLVAELKTLRAYEETFSER
jgi:hypothetical protein